MVHLRLNETEVNPNPNINFITPLPSVPDIRQESLHVLRALAAQVKPVMKAHGFQVNSFEEVRFWVLCPATRARLGTRSWNGRLPSESESGSFN